MVGLHIRTQPVIFQLRVNHAQDGTMALSPYASDGQEAPFLAQGSIRTERAREYMKGWLLVAK